jgi:hypothetical protein
MITQPFPLIAVDVEFGEWLVIGWKAAAMPTLGEANAPRAAIVVPHGQAGLDEMGPRILPFANVREWMIGGPDREQSITVRDAP